MTRHFFLGLRCLCLSAAGSSLVIGSPCLSQINPQLRRGGIDPASLRDVQVIDRPPLCLTPLVATQVTQDLQAVAPTANVVCQSFPGNSSSPCGNLSQAAQLSLISTQSYDENGFRLQKNDSVSFVDVPIPAGKTALYVQESTDLPINYSLIYDQNGRTSQLFSGIARQGNIVVTTSRGRIEQEIPVTTFPSGSTNRRAHLANNSRSRDLFLSRIYFKRWSCVKPVPYNP
jgi:hypothetical protein